MAAPVQTIVREAREFKLPPVLTHEVGKAYELPPVLPSASKAGHAEGRVARQELLKPRSTVTGMLFAPVRFVDRVVVGGGYMLGMAAALLGGGFNIVGKIPGIGKPFARAGMWLSGIHSGQAHIRLGNVVQAVGIRDTNPIGKAVLGGGGKAQGVLKTLAGYLDAAVAPVRNMMRGRRLAQWAMAKGHHAAFTGSLGEFCGQVQSHPELEGLTTHLTELGKNAGRNAAYLDMGAMMEHEQAFRTGLESAIKANPANKALAGIKDQFSAIMKTAGKAEKAARGGSPTIALARTNRDFSLRSLEELSGHIKNSPPAFGGTALLERIEALKGEIGKPVQHLKMDVVHNSADELRALLKEAGKGDRKLTLLATKCRSHLSTAIEYASEAERAVFEATHKTFASRVEQLGTRMSKANITTALSKGYIYAGSAAEAYSIGAGIHQGIKAVKLMCADVEQTSASRISTWHALFSSGAPKAVREVRWQILWTSLTRTFAAAFVYIGAGIMARRSPGQGAMLAMVGQGALMPLQNFVDKNNHGADAYFNARTFANIQMPKVTRQIDTLLASGKITPQQAAEQREALLQQHIQNCAEVIGYCSPKAKKMGGMELPAVRAIAEEYVRQGMTLGGIMRDFD